MTAAHGVSSVLSKVFSLVWSPLAILSSWQLLSGSGILDPLFFPPPLELLESAGEMIRSGELTRHLAATLSRMIQGFAYGTSVGVLCGVAMGAFPTIRHALDPLISALWASPKLTLLPMLIIIVGIGDAPKIILISLGCFILVALHTLDGMRAVNPAYLSLARNYGASSFAVWRKVYLPAISPAVFTAARLALGRALTLTVSVELVNSAEGIGYLVFTAWQGFNMDRLYIAIVITAGMGMFFHASLRLLEKRLIVWR